MTFSKKKLFVLTIKENNIGFGVYTVIGKLSHTESYQEQTFSHDTFQEGFLFNLPMFADSLTHFLSSHTKKMPTIICLDDKTINEGIYLKKEHLDKTFKETIKIQTLELPTCCDITSRIYKRYISYEILIQYTLLFELLDCPIISIISPFTSLIYYNHQYGGINHQITNTDYKKISTLLEKRCFFMLRNKLNFLHDDKNQSILQLYSLTTASVGAHSI